MSRTEQIYRALLASYGEPNGETCGEILRDVLTDLRHLADEYGEDYAVADAMAQVHYEAELGPTPEADALATDSARPKPSH